MRRYGRYCLAMVFIVLAVWLYAPIFLARAQTWFRHLQSDNLHNLSIAATHSLVYPIKPKQWLTFAVPEESQQLRIITNAHTQRSEAVVLDPNRAYALHYELLDKKGVVLAKGLYHQYSSLTPYKDSQGELMYGNNYSNKDVVPLDGRIVLLGLEAIKSAAFLRVSMETANPGIFEAAVRVYVPTKIAEHQIATSWLRMSQAEKDNLAKDSIYPGFLLSAAEQTNLLKHQWKPIGPMGIEGKTYQTMTLYTVKDNVAAVQDTLMLASGLQADAQHYGVIPIQEHGGQITLTFKALDGSTLTTPVAVNLQWFGRNKEQRWQQNTVWTKDSGGLDFQLDGGLLVIRPSSQVIVNAYLTTESEPKHDITDALISIKSYRASFGINFNVLHYQQRSTALRLDVRRLLIAGTKPNQESVRYQWLNAEQQIIASGELNALEQPSLFVRAGNITDAASNVSEPLSYYFNLPAEVTSLRLIANTPELIVTAYNQPYGLIKWQRIPEDAYIANDHQDHQLGWFPLRAVNDEKLMQQQAIQWLSGQYRLPEESPDVLAGQYLWHDYMPQSDAAARFLLTDYTGDEPRADAAASIYCALPVNHDNEVQLTAVKNLRSIAPELVFLRDNASPFTAAVFFNQQEALNINSIGQQGIMHLPEIAVGTQHIRLNTNNGGRWFMNHQANCAGQRYLKRRVFALNADTPLDFIVQHAPEDEAFSARLYSPAHTVDRSQIKVNIDAITAVAPSAPVVSNWTYKNRLYDIRPLSKEAMPVLYAQGQSVTNGERFTISLNSDLPAGAYRIRLALAKGPSGYITLSQIIAGEHEQRRFYRESALETQ